MRYTQHSKNTPNRLTLAVVSLLSAMALTACGGGGGGSSTPSTGGGQSGNNGSSGGNNGSGNNPTHTQPVINELVVTTLNDVVNAKDDVNSLREAVEYASKHGGTITFKDDLKGKLTLKNQININNSPKPFTIKGKGDDIKIDGNNTVRLFEINDSTVSFDNLVLQNANIPSNNRYYRQGGAAIHAKKSNINLNNVKLLNNKISENAGGAIFAQDSNISIIGGEMTGNEGYDGGAIYSSFNNKLSINGTKFDNNTCVSPSTSHRCHGGAIAHIGLNIDITNAKFTSNTGGRVSDSDKTSESMGGAVFLDINQRLNKTDSAKAGNATITKTTFSNNSAGINSSGRSTWGGAIMINSDLVSQPRYTVTIKDSKFNGNISAKGHGGAIYVDDNNTLNITGSTFINNHSTAGGAVKISSGKLTVKNSNFVMNNGGGTGGAIHISTSSTLTLDKIKFKNNIAKVYGGAVSLDGKSAVITNSTFEGNRTTDKNAGSGGGLYAFVSDIQIKNTNFINNSSRQGGGIYASATAKSNSLDTVTFKNNKAIFQGGGMYYVGKGKHTLTIKNITTSGNTSSDKYYKQSQGIYCNCESVNNLGGNKFGDPNQGI